MSSQKGRRNRRQHQFRVIANGVRRQQPNIPRLVQVSLEMYLAEQERAAQAGTTVEPKAEEQPDEPR